MWVALERAVRLCLQDGLSRYLLNGCGDGFPKWWLLKAIDESRLSKPDNGNVCEIWVGPTIGSVECLHRLQLIRNSWKHTSAMPCHYAAGLSLPCSCCVLNCLLVSTVHELCDARMAWRHVGDNVMMGAHCLKYHVPSCSQSMRTSKPKIHRAPSTLYTRCVPVTL